MTLIATLLGAGAEADAAWASAPTDALVVYIGGDRAFVARVEDSDDARRLTGRIGQRAMVEFSGRQPLRCRLSRVRLPLPAADGLERVSSATPVSTAALRLTPEHAAPLFLHPEGAFSTSGDGLDTDPSAALVTAARWVSSRRTTSFERLFPASAFHPDQPIRSERLSVAQGEGLLQLLQAALQTHAVRADAPASAAQTRSACLTVLSHLVATSLRDPEFRALSSRAADQILALIDAESAPGGVASLRAHAITLLQLRGPALTPAQRERAKTLLRSSLRESPPYAELSGVWSFAICSDWEFHEGECNILLQRGFRELARERRGIREYRVFEAPFRNPQGEAIRLYARDATPSNENEEMGDPGFIGLLINRHAQLGVYDMRASMTRVKQQGYKLMMNSQCAGLTTRSQISRLFPDADIYSSWDSTYFRTGPDRKVTHSEGMDCFLVVLQGMAASETHAQLSARIERAQWYHEAGNTPEFVQFVGPAHPTVVSRFSDVNNDGKADIYDGFLDLMLASVGEDLLTGSTPRDPGVAASQISGEAAVGLGWAAGSLNRVSQYSDLWDGLPGESELLHPFVAAGFFDAGSVPTDVAGVRPGEDLGALPAVCRYRKDEGVSVEVLFSARLAHAPKELKRLLVLAEAVNRGFDAQMLPARGVLATRLGQRAMVLLGMAGLLDFPADQNQLDQLWSRALVMLGMPPISRTTVRACITEADHDASNYYGSVRGVQQLVGRGGDDKGGLGASDPVLWAQLNADDPAVGRARPLSG